MTKKKPVNYLKNKDLLEEIQKSKMSYCWLRSDEYKMYDVILHSKDDIPGAVAEARENRAKRLKNEGYDKAKADHTAGKIKTVPKQKDFAIDPEDINKHDLVFRVYTYEHIPLQAGRKKNIKKEGDKYVKLPFLPFKQYAYINGELAEVARSHWNGDLESGEFDGDAGELTPKLGMQFLMLVERYSRRANWRGYTYVDEMRGQALLQLSQIALQFDESKSDNPFAYYTATVNNSFTRVLNIEKRNQDIRDNILIDQGHLPSYGRQLDHEQEIRQLRENVETPEGEM